MFAGELIDKAIALQNRMTQIGLALQDIDDENRLVIKLLEDEYKLAIEALNKVRQQEVTVNG